MPTRLAFTPLCLLMVAIVWLLGHELSHAAPEKPVAKVTYAEHVQAIFREHCFTCHNQNKARNDLALDSYERLMKGGASGEVIRPGNPDDSYLYRVVTHADEPKMPPGQEKLPETKLTLIKLWIAGGALKDSGSKTVTVEKPKLVLSLPTGAGRPAGEPVIPVGLVKQPPTASTRSGPVVALAASPWAPVIALAGQQQVAFYQSDKRELLGYLAFPEGLPRVVRFSRSGTAFFAAGGQSVRHGKTAVYNVRDGKRLFTVGDELDIVLAADLHPALTQVALGGPERLVKIYAADGTPIRQIKKHTDWIYAVEYSPDGVLLATADRAGGLWVWESATGNEYQGLEGHQGAVNDLSWRADSNVLASAGEDGTLRLWEMNDGKQIKNVRAHAGGVLAVRFSHDGRLVTGGRDKLVKTWDIEGRPLKTIGPMADIVLAVTFTHDGKAIVAGDFAGQVQIWNAADGKPIGQLPNH